MGSEERLKSQIAILGAGSFGTALALYLARRDQTVKLWSIETKDISNMLNERVNNRYLPGIHLPDAIHPCADLALTIKDTQDVVVVVPSAGFRQTLMMLRPLIDKNRPPRILCATKGLDPETGDLLNHVAKEVLGKDLRFAVLSGPSFAREVARGLPAALALASEDQSFLKELITRFDSPIFRIHPSDDVIGVEVGGVVKNVIAIATGILDGKGLGANARSALMTQGLAETIRLGEALGGKAKTFVGLSGLGDLILTCSDDQSRNRRLGLAIGKGQDVKLAEAEIGQVVEGKRNAEEVVALAKKHHINMPICETVFEILQSRSTVDEAFHRFFEIEV
jgi:glycerol-3-phosphate dehydrogenase (NAD(P)+)